MVHKITSPAKVGLFIFSKMEELDMVGPLEVFGAAGNVTAPGSFEVFTVAARPEPVICTNGLSLNPAHTFADCPELDMLVLPGGIGTRLLLDNQEVIDWIKKTAEKAGIVLSVCTGSLLLAKAGLLSGLQATTHYSSYDFLAELEPEVKVAVGERFADNGRIITAAGVSAGIDAAFHILARVLGNEAATATAKYIEYELRA